MKPQIRFCTSADGTRIGYAIMGEGPPLVSVHGWPSSFEMQWKHPDCRLFYEGVSGDRQYIAFDHRGVGASQREVNDVSLEARVADVAALADHLRLRRFDLLGFYDGACVAAAYAAEYPEKVSRLVLYALMPRIEDATLREAVATLAELLRKNWSLGKRALTGMAFPSGPIELQRWWSDVLRRSVSPGIAARYYESVMNMDVSRHVSQIRAPTLVLHRSGDRFVPIDAGRAAAALVPDARFVSLEGEIGIPYMGDPSYIQTIADFLDEERVAEAASAATLAPADVHTILFTDMESSTALTQRLGDARAQDVLRAHNTIVRDALKAHSGSEIKHTGDGIMASFTSASRALECAIAIQRALAQHNESSPGTPIRVRIGLNAGEPVAEEKDLFGTAVQLAARVAAKAEGEEILVSDTLRGLVAGKGFLFADRGDVALRGFEDPVRLFELRWAEER